MKYAIIAAACLLSACAHTNGPPVVEQRTVEVVREVQKPCPAERPKRPDKLVQPLPTDGVQLAAVLSVKLLEYAGPGGYADRAEAFFDECLK